MKKVIILLGIALSVFSCQKIEFEESKCEVIEGGPSITQRFFEYPSFNPKNSDEFVFLHQDFTYQSGQPIIELVRYNWKSGKSEVVKEFNPDMSFLFYAVAWSKSDWIAYIEDKKVRVIKSNGSEYTELGIEASDLKFGEDGKLYCSVYDYANASNFLLSYDLGTKAFDTVAFLAAGNHDMRFDISKEHKLTSANILNAPLVKGQKVNLGTYYGASWKGIGHNGNFAYSADGNYIYFTQDILSGTTIKRMDVASKSVESIVPICEIVNYRNMDFSKDGKYMIVEKNYIKLTGFYPTPTVKREVVIIDLATMKEKAIDY